MAYTFMWKKDAKKIYENGITLEEYIKILSN